MVLVLLANPAPAFSSGHGDLSTLVKQLGDKDAGRARNARERLERIGPAASPLLIAALRGGDAAVAAGALVLATRLGGVRRRLRVPA